MATYMHYSMHILSVLLDFKMKKHLLSTGSQNSIRTLTIEENAMEELVWISKLLPRNLDRLLETPSPDDGGRKQFHITQNKVKV